MKKSLYILFFFLLLAGSFLVGSWYSQRDSVKKNNPSPVIPLGVSAGTDTLASSLAPGAVRISPEKQQIIGVRIGKVEKTSASHTLRTLGRVAVDENRIYRVIIPVEGWVKEIRGGTTGSVVQKDELLARFYARDILAPQQAYFYAINAQERFKKEGMDTTQQNYATNAQIRSAEEALLALGMGETQVKEIAKTRQTSRDIDIRAPATGLVLQRNIFPGQRFDRGTEWYRIADLSRIWVLADTYENEAQYFRPGMRGRVILPFQKKVFSAKILDVPPQFDITSRTLKVRMEVENPGFLLRPDMFVDVEFPVNLPPAVTVPMDAILDSGLKRVVFVERGNGFFEPREVETGWRIGNQVEIIRGLEVGEKIVTSGTFLIDSESKLELAAQGMYTPLSKDPVCGADVAIRKAEKASLKAIYKGKTYYFDSEECKHRFEKESSQFIKAISEETSVESTPPKKSLRNKDHGHDHS